MNFAAAMDPLLMGENLGYEDARDLMRYLTSGEASDAQIGAACTALRIKTATATELAAFASILRDQRAGGILGFEDFVDTCGTGGGVPSFNISTAAAFVACAAGVKIAKHGNRAVTSTCGSADVLQALGAEIQTNEEVLRHLLNTVGIGFLFAPAFHPGMKNVGAARRSLGYRTVFNQLGPLSNPLGAKRQLIGVYDPKIGFPMAEALMLLGTERALLAHGEDGLDEISPVAPTRFSLLWDGELSQGILTPAGFGLEPVAPSAILPGNSVEENAALLREAVTTVDSQRCTAILPSAACAIWIAGLAPDRKSATEAAREAVLSGAAAHKLDEFVEKSQGA